MRFILASKSPRRAAILKSRGIIFEVLENEVHETSEERTPLKFCENIAKLKLENARDILSRETNKTPAVILTSDTVVVYQNEIFGKPKTESDAKEMLMKLSGSDHEVITSICIGMINVDKEYVKISSDKTRITFLSLNDIIIDKYLSNSDFSDKAGGYAIQGDCCFFVSNIQGSLSNVIGLPIELLTDQLNDLIMSISGKRIPFSDFFKM